MLRISKRVFYLRIFKFNYRLLVMLSGNRQVNLLYIYCLSLTC